MVTGPPTIAQAVALFLKTKIDFVSLQITDLNDKYSCQVEKSSEQHLRQAQKIEDIIESHGSAVSHGDIERKPLKMHWRTFARLTERNDYHKHQSLIMALATLRL